ncbi:DUF3575 domain-containing protein [Pseudotenacibaculum sp. MALMAid0570]|uniref:DUF3575 domain-containing protein n=1 Tax=Pseudotenacibaculum sp. MALMAid0570 TaxID=3143938 RepID=UPI0032DF7B61
MKKLILLIAFLYSGIAIAQEEIKVNITDALALKTLTASYEHYFTEQTSAGVSGLFNFEDDSSDFRYNENLSITPFVRHYFSTESLWNLFGELFLSYNTGDDDRIENGVIVEDNYTDGALGLAIGYKYISSGGFTVDIHGGLGRNLFSDESPRIVPRVGVNVGFQF